MMNTKLILLDIDGTLTDDEKRIMPATKEALLRAQEKGVLLALASARPVHGLDAYKMELHMEDYHGLLMAYNGGSVQDASTGKVLTETHMELEQTKSLLRFLETLPVTVILDDGNQFYVTDAKGYKVEYECRNNGMTYTVVDNLADFLSFCPVKLLLSVVPEQILEVQEKIAAYLDETLTVVRTAAFYLEIFPKVINKGMGLRTMCEYLGLDIRDTASFGDSQNDIPMIEAAGCGIAMANAEDAVKQAADQVTLSNNEDGIAYALKEILHII